jgi:hypothetical protein
MAATGTLPFAVFCWSFFVPSFCMERTSLISQGWRVL